MFTKMRFVGRIGLHDTKMTEERHIIRPGTGIVKSGKERAAPLEALCEISSIFWKKSPLRMNAGVSDMPFSLHFDFKVAQMSSERYHRERHRYLPVQR